MTLEDDDKWVIFDPDTGEVIARGVGQRVSEETRIVHNRELVINVRNRKILPFVRKTNKP